MASVTLSGVELHVDVHGAPGPDVPAVVLLHGLGSSAEDWGPVCAALAPRHRVLAVDLHGHGRSRVRGRLTIDRAAADVGRALDALGEPAVHVIGLSLGGCVALALALREPRRVRSLTLVNAFAKLAPAGVTGAVRMLQRLVLVGVAPMDVVAAHVAAGLFPRAEQRDAYRAAVASLSRTPRRTYLGTMRALGSFDVRARLREVGCPTLIVVGDRDRTVPRAAADLLRRSIPGARLIVIPDSGHATPHDRPEAFTTAVLDFLATAD